MQKAFVDSQGLFNAPTVPNSVQWSDEGLLAVSTGNSIALLHPGKLSGPRGFIGFSQPCDVAALEAPGQPQDIDDVHYQLNNSRRAAYTSSFRNLQVDVSARATAWSPLGCSSHGGCLLAVVTNDHRVLVYGPPYGLRSEWRAVANLSCQLLQHLQHTQWQGIDPPEAAGVKQPGAAGAAAEQEGGGAASTLRLRGGARTKRKHPELEERAAASQLEPAMQEGGGAAEGNEGAAAPREVGDGGPSGAEGNGGAAAGGEEDVGPSGVAGEGAAEPQPPPAKTGRVWPKKAKVEVEAGAAADAPGKKAGPSLSKRKSVPKRAAAGDGERGVGGKEDEAEPSTQPRPADKTAGAAAAGGASSGDKKKGAGGSAKKGGKAAAVAAEAEGQEGEGAGGYQVPEGFSAADLPPVTVSQKASATKSSFLIASARRFLELRRELPQDSLPTYETPNTHLYGADAALLERVLAEFTAAHGPALPAARLHPKAFATELRRKLREVWDRCRNQVVKKGLLVDANAAEESAAAPGVAPPAVMAPAARVAVKAEARQEAGGREGEGDAEVAGDAAEGDGEGSEEEGAGGGGGKHKRKRRQNKRPKRKEGEEGPGRLEVYEIPEGFCWKDLPPVDTTTPSAARRSITVAAVERFLALRQEYPPEELPQYQWRSEHLRERDLWLVERVTSEFCGAYVELLGELNLDARKFQTAWLHRLRLKWDRVTGESEVLPGAQQAEAEVAADIGVGLPEGDGAPSMQRTSRVRRAASAATLTSPGGAEAGDTKGKRARPSAPAMPGMPWQGNQIGISARTPSLRWFSEAQSTLPSAAYQMRLFTLSTLCVAWSPLCAGGAGAPEWCMLAVGSKSGHVWLWRHTPSQPCAAPPERSASDSATPAQGAGGFVLVGCLRGPLSWVNCLSWVKLPGPQGGALALVAGTSDGGISLYGASVERLANLAPLPLGADAADGAPAPQQGSEGSSGAAAAQPWLQQYVAMERWGTLCAPDLRPVCSLAVCLVPASPSSAGACRLLVAAGKTMGALALWQSGDLQLHSVDSTAAAKSDAVSAHLTAAEVAAHYRAAVHTSCQGAGATTMPGLHGPYSITGLAWAPVPAPPRPAPGLATAGQTPPAPPLLPLLCSCSRDGATKCWQLSPGGAAPLQRPAPGMQRASGEEGTETLGELPGPQPCARRAKEEAGHGVYGVAASPNGLFLASITPKFAPDAMYKKQFSTHKKVMQSYLHLDRLWGAGAPLRADSAAAACAARMVQEAAAAEEACSSTAGAAGSPGALWDLLQLLALPKWHGEEAQQAQQAGGAAVGAPGPAAAASAPPEVGADVAAAPLSQGEGGGGEAMEVDAAEGGMEGGSAGPSRGAAPAAAASGPRARTGLAAAGGGAPTGSASSDLAARVIAQLEAPFLALLSSCASAGAEQEGVLVCANPASWRGLQLATVLRRALRPPSDEGRRLAAAKQQRQQPQGAPAAATGEPPQVGSGVRQPAPVAAAATARWPSDDGVQNPGPGIAAAAPTPQQEAPPPQDAWGAALERNEMFLLQRNIYAALTTFLGAPARHAQQQAGTGTAAEQQGDQAPSPAEDEARLSALLMADWTMANVRNGLLQQEVMQLAARVYLQAGEALPNHSQLPAREASSLFGGAPVALTGQGIAAATSAVVREQGGSITIPRCPATLRLVETVRPWACRACARRYPPPAPAPRTAVAAQQQPPPQQQQQQKREGEEEGEGASGGGGAPTMELDGARQPGSHGAGAAGALPRWPLCVFCGVAAGPTALAVQLLFPCSL